MKNLKNWFRPAILRMKGYTPGEQPRDPSVIKLNTNENPYPPSRAVVKAAKAAVEDRLRLYPDPAAEPLRRRLAAVYHWPLDGIMVGNGSDGILADLFRAAVGKNDLVQCPDITYSLYPVLANISEARLREVPLDDDWDLPFHELSTTARLTLWGYPNPPVGNCFDLSKMAAYCGKAKGLVLIDEAYVDFAERDCLSLARAHSNVLVLRTLSKSFSLAGARLGYVFGHPSVVRELMKVKDSYNVNRVTQAMALAALGPAGLRDMKASTRRIKAERRKLASSLRSMGFLVPESQANFLMAEWMEGLDTGELYKKLKKKGVLVRYFSHPRLRGSLRITVGSPAQNTRLLKELSGVLSS